MGKSNQKEPSRTSEICEEVLWNSKMIISNGDSLFNKYSTLKAIMTIRDIIDEYGVPLSWQDAQQKYSLNSSLVFHCSTMNGTDLLRTSQRLRKVQLLRNTPHLPGNNRNEHCIITSKIEYQRLLNPLQNHELFKIH